MLYFSLIVVASLMFAAHQAAMPYPRRVRFLEYVFGALPLLGLLSILIPSIRLIFLSFVFLSLALLLWMVIQHRVRYFWPYSVTAVMIAFALTAYLRIPAVQEIEKVRQLYPYESIANRLPKAPSTNPVKLEPEAEQRLERMEDGLKTIYFKRSGKLEYLHEYTITQFVIAPGAGIGRLPAVNLERLDELSQPREPVEHKLFSFSPEPPPEGEFPFVGSLDDFHTLNRFATVDFADVETLGYVKDRDHVAGFMPHAFSKMPDVDAFAVNSVELISLLLHSKPMVYISNQLPAMDKLKNNPVRPLDPFETKGLEVVRQGEDLYVARFGERIRMVGAIRNAKQCVKCHQGQRGDLLGAFVYSLREATKSPPTKKESVEK